MTKSNSNDIVNLLRMRACPPEGDYIESDHGHSDCYLEREAADEIERLRLLINEWVDADDDDEAPDGVYYAAWLALRRSVGR